MMMIGPVKRWKIRRHLKRIEALKAKAAEQFDAIPTRQLRRQAERKARKTLTAHRGTRR